MTKVKIYKPSPTAMQSGRLKTRWWVVEFEKKSFSCKEPLMHWNSAADTQQQLSLRFSSLEQAVHYAQQQGFSYKVIQPFSKAPSKIRPYSSNFILKRDAFSPF